MCDARTNVCKNCPDQGTYFASPALLDQHQRSVHQMEVRVVYAQLGGERKVISRDLKTGDFHCVHTPCFKPDAKLASPKAMREHALKCGARSLREMGLVYLQAWRALICSACKVAIDVSRVSAHFKEAHEEPPCTGATTAAAHNALQADDQAVDSPGKLVTPAADAPIIAELTLKEEYVCTFKTCTFTAVDVEDVEHHQRTRHGNSMILAPPRLVKKQRWYKCGEWFEVARIATPPRGAATALPSMEDDLAAMRQAQYEVDATATLQHERGALDRWAHTSGFNKHLLNGNRLTMASLARASGDSSEEKLVEEMTLKVFRAGSEAVANLPPHILVDVTRLDATSHGDLFKATAVGTQKRYAGTWARVLLFVLRSVQQYGQTSFAEAKAAQVEPAWQIVHGLNSELRELVLELASEEPRDVQAAVLSVTAALLARKEIDGGGTSVVRVAVAAMSVDRAGGWVQPWLVTPSLSAILYAARLFALVSHLRKHKLLAMHTLELVVVVSDEHASLFRMFASECWEDWPSVHTATLKATSGNYILPLALLRACGRRFAAAAGRPGTFDWASDESFRFEGRPYLMSTVRAMAQSMLVKLDSALNELLELVGAKRAMHTKLDLSTLRDNPTAAAAGVSLISQNSHIAQSSYQKYTSPIYDELRSEDAQCNVTWDKERVKKIMTAEHKFLGVVLVCINLLGGLPRRGTEVTTVSHVNTHEHLRSLVLGADGGMYVSPCHSKVAEQTYPPKFLPLDVTQGITKYLLYARTFTDLLRHRVHSVSPSPWLFVNVKSGEAWTSKTAGAVTQSHMVAANLGTNMYLLKSRQFFAGVANRFLSSGIDRLLGQADEEDELDEEAFEGLNAVANAGHLQAGHSTAIAKRHYGIDMAQRANQTNDVLALGRISSNRFQVKVLRLSSLQAVGVGDQVASWVSKAGHSTGLTQSNRVLAAHAELTARLELVLSKLESSAASGSANVDQERLVSGESDLEELSSQLTQGVAAFNASAAKLIAQTEDQTQESIACTRSEFSLCEHSMENRTQAATATVTATQHSVTDAEMTDAASTDTSAIYTYAPDPSTAIQARAVRQVLGLSAEASYVLRPQQAKALSAVQASSSPVIIVLGTGEGKTLVWMVPALMDRTTITVVIMPYLALITDMTARCKEVKLNCIEYRSGISAKHLSEGCNVIMTTIDQAVRSPFAELVHELAMHSRLARVVLDEAHSLIFDAGFRACMQMSRKLGELSPHLVAMTATLPPAIERDLVDLLFDQETADTAFVIRSPSTARLNIRYEAHRCIDDDEIANKAFAMVSHHLEEPTSGQVLVICRTAQGSTISAVAMATRFGLKGAVAASHDQHGPVRVSEPKQDLLAQWLCGSETLLVGTSCVGTGIDVTNVTLVLAVGCPYGLIEWSQQSGRGGRDGSPVRAAVLYSPSVMNQKVNNPNARALEIFLQGSTCKRACLSSFLDKAQADCLGYGPLTAKCDFCSPRRFALLSSRSGTAAPEEQGIDASFASSAYHAPLFLGSSSTDTAKRSSSTHSTSKRIASYDELRVQPVEELNVLLQLRVEELLGKCVQCFVFGHPHEHATAKGPSCLAWASSQSALYNAPDHPNAKHYLSKWRALNLKFNFGTCDYKSGLPDTMGKDLRATHSDNAELCDMIKTVLRLLTRSPQLLAHAHATALRIQGSHSPDIPSLPTCPLAWDELPLSWLNAAGREYAGLSLARAVTLYPM